MVTALLAACTVGPDYVAPQPELPATWADLAPGVETADEVLDDWWTSLGDPVLVTLITKAVDGSKQLDGAFARIRQARALRAIATGVEYPDLNAVGAVTRERLSADLEPVLPTTLSRTDNYASVGLVASWELDVWGRVRRLVESADAELAASVDMFRDVLVLLLAEVGQTYVEIRTLQQRLDITQHNVDSQSQTLQLTQDRFDAKLSPELDVAQAELNLADTQSSVPGLRQQLAGAIQRLGVLVGEPAANLTALLAQGDAIPVPPDSVAVGIPADLLRRRPDIRSAERVLAAETARIGVATAALYPNFALSGSFGYAATRDLFDSDNRTWTLGPVASWNLFDGGRVRGSIDLAEARTAEALAAYEQTVLQALADVERTLVGFAEEREKVAILERAAAAAVKSVSLVKVLYDLGLTDFQNVQAMEAQQFVQQDRLEESRGRVTQQFIGLYLALGGGWQPETERAEARAAQHSSEWTTP